MTLANEMVREYDISIIRVFRLSKIFFDLYQYERTNSGQVKSDKSAEIGVARRFLTLVFLQKFHLVGKVIFRVSLNL